MEREYLSFAEAKKIPITEFLSGFGINPVKVRGNDYWYLSPFRTETNPSFKVGNLKNVWYDHGSGEGGTILGLGAKLNQCSIKDFVEIEGCYRFEALKVSPSSSLPDSKPLRNQRTRCAEVPWVKASGTTCP